MSVSPSNIDTFSLLWWVIGLTLTFILVSVCVYIILVLRRMIRNHHGRYLNRLRQNFDEVMNQALLQKKPIQVLNPEKARPAHISALVGVLLHYFRILDVAGAAGLRELIDRSDLEPYICKSTQKNAGTVGRRMEAMQALSYLTSDRSKDFILAGLEDRNKYIQLTSARCLARRGEIYHLPEIMKIINLAFPDDEKVLTDILYRFGKPALNLIERQVQIAPNAALRAACLKAMVMLMPARTDLVLSHYKNDEDDRVRAATVELAQICKHREDIDFLNSGLRDSSTKVKICSAKLALQAKRVDTLENLFSLSSDPLMWVRYWSIRAIWNMGVNGQKLVRSMASIDNPAGHMAKEVSAECSKGYVSL